MKFIDLPIDEFLQKLSSTESVPSGGGVSALCGSMAASLDLMVVRLTLGKKKYKQYEMENTHIERGAQKILEGFKKLVDEDAEIFLPLSKCYALPEITPKQREYKKQEISRCSIDACSVPIKIIDLSEKCLKLTLRLEKTGTRLALSDVAIAALLLNTAVNSAWMNVLINMSSIENPEFVKFLQDEVLKKVEELSATSISIAERIEKEI